MALISEFFGHRFEACCICFQAVILEDALGPVMLLAIFLFASFFLFSHLLGLAAITFALSWQRLAPKNSPILFFEFTI